MQRDQGRESVGAMDPDDVVEEAFAMAESFTGPQDLWVGLSCSQSLQLCRQLLVPTAGSFSG